MQNRSKKSCQIVKYTVLIAVVLGMVFLQSPVKALAQQKKEVYPPENGGSEQTIQTVNPNTGSDVLGSGKDSLPPGKHQELDFPEPQEPTESNTTTIIDPNPGEG